MTLVYVSIIVIQLALVFAMVCLGMTIKTVKKNEEENVKKWNQCRELWEDNHKVWQEQLKVNLVTQGASLILPTVPKEYLEAEQVKFIEAVENLKEDNIVGSPKDTDLF